MNHFLPKFDKINHAKTSLFNVLYIDGLFDLKPDCNEEIKSKKRVTINMHNVEDKYAPQYAALHLHPPKIPL